ncbi:MULTISPECIES: hypothetical protein [Morganellaceae]|uniref:hypothetical protein n=1 Tax=Morganellaceae TaxID=1903414 RepID=UPI0018E48AA4|nr:MULTISPECIES: hypothetical protein [Morganellaceae]MBI6529977.1 hypothetical protein [Proteus vulgaris]MBP6082198.1 hypothetical protein [Providencia sp.]
MNNIALLQHIGSEFITHSGVTATLALEKIHSGYEAFINELSPSGLLELLENPLPIIINILTGEPHSVIHSHSEDLRPNSKTYGYGVGYEVGNIIIILASGIDTYYHALKGKLFLKSENYMPLFVSMIDLNGKHEVTKAYY